MELKTLQQSCIQTRKQKFSRKNNFLMYMLKNLSKEKKKFNLEMSKIYHKLTLSGKRKDGLKIV